MRRGVERHCGCHLGRLEAVPMWLYYNRPVSLLLSAVMVGVHTSACVFFSFRCANNLESCESNKRVILYTFLPDFPVVSYFRKFLKQCYYLRQGPFPISTNCPSDTGSFILSFSLAHEQFLPPQSVLTGASPTVPSTLGGAFLFLRVCS